ncbi:4-hydroxy-3-methylbut-2-enyl diphosphate reductase [Ruficoccus amylovorans]|uniref:4-hydroxy-3-methylbut-2-enyl diphosphate reductase n=1 Tax=Ruficoccus amylovorans TaxID=1804625 RepID=A0A842H9M9_9BACT|nr:4-hydroxy-3-methylbut-2-enyl diphosphate reductase [Ruficoccus amylovorans]MBC2592985.1 4-hydroxy-3-methylbut-2-enyl diphosphate reductase [Ruficoccus amylovorans]
MEVIRAQSAGFCWGVERAINVAAKFAEEGKRPVYTDGPLIHNKQMMEKLEAVGIQEVGDYQSKTEVKVTEQDREHGVLVVRAHGISPERRSYLKELGMDFKDATCPDVGIIAGKIKLHSRKGFTTVIFGDPKHPEVIGLMGYTEDRGYVVKNEEDIRALPNLGDKVCFVSQSTMFTDEFERLAAILRETYPDAQVFDTICGATKERQSDIHVLKDAGAEAIIVVGGRHSANTRKLAALVEKTGLPAYHVETASELDFGHLKERYKKVGVTAGASTPEFLIQEVVEELQRV